MRRLLAATALLGVLASPAFAWDYIQNGPGQQIGDGATGNQSNSKAKASARASAQSYSSSQGGHASAAGGNVNIGSVGNGGGNGNGGYAPTLSVPDGYGNAPCGGGIGLGGAGGFGGGSGGGTLWEFGDCKRMRESAALRTLGYPDAALAELCQIDRVRQAFGGQCPTTRVVATQAAGPPDYCFTRNAGDKNQHAECNGQRMLRR